MRYHFAKQLPLFLSLVIGCLFLGCSNSEWTDLTNKDESIAEGENPIITQQDTQDVEETKNEDISESSSVQQTVNQSSSSKITVYLPIDDTEYPYAGIPRIVIETRNRQEIEDRETEIPAKLQIWGKKAPISEIMDLTIRGRGNESWSHPKKPYAIKFDKKQTILGMPEAKKWVMLANYRDRTLIRNAVALELARKTSLTWTPQGKFVDVFLNKKFIGNYYICEKIEVKKNRLELNDDSYLLEFDTYYDEEYKFRTEQNNLPVNIKYPPKPDSSQFNYIKNFIDATEFAFQTSATDTSFLNYIDAPSFADYFIIYALATNGELEQPKSLYVHKKNKGKLYAGPAWDFDYDTFNSNKIGFANRNGTFVKQFMQKELFHNILQERWATIRKELHRIDNFIDSLSSYTHDSNAQNIKLWPIKIEGPKIGDEDKNFEDAIEMLKDAFNKQYTELDDLIGPTGTLKGLYGF